VGYVAPASLAGLVWRDEDGDSLRDADEGGLPGITLFARRDHDGDGVYDRDVRAATTGAEGAWRFVALLPGRWQVQVDLATAGGSLSAVAVSTIGSATVYTSAGTLLILPPFEVLDFAAGTHGLPIPNQCAFVGLSVWTQGASLDGPGGIELTNALDLTLGTF